MRKPKPVVFRPIISRKEAEICRKKTRDGNVFEDGKEAENLALDLKHRNRLPIEAYFCQCCRKWHVGKNTERR
jgi:hypothetical protein